MSIIDDCVQFLEDLILGDFNDQQMVSAQVIGGLISLIPVMDQVMDVRDISGCIYRINKRGGFGKATLDDKVDLGFAAFGVVPAVGSAFKTVFKPLYKQRKAAKGMINGGVAMIERMLGQKKGGAVRWVQTLDWAGNTQAAIVQADMALESCISLLEYLGQSHWWCPDRIEGLARDVAPSLRAMRGKLAAPIREAAGEIRKFLEGLLGEHAAAVAMSVAAGGGTGVRAGPKARGRGNAGTRHASVGDKPRTQGKNSQAGVVNRVQRTAWDDYLPLAKPLKGLIGEHIVEHYTIEKKNWGLKWNRHDVLGGSPGKRAGWQGEYRKINDEGIPISLCTRENVVLRPGIDAAWFTNRPAPHQFAVVEAKASHRIKPVLLSLLSEVKGKQGVSSGNRGHRPSSKGASGGNGKKLARKPKNVLQMSREWIDDRLRSDAPRWLPQALENYSRHVFVVTPLQAVEHIDAVAKIVERGMVDDPGQAQEFAHLHTRHDVQIEFNERDIVLAEKQYAKSGKPNRPVRTKNKGKK